MQVQLGSDLDGEVVLPADGVGEEVQARPVSAVLALVGMAIEGEPGSEIDPNERESLRLRAAAVRVFEVKYSGSMMSS